MNNPMHSLRRFSYVVRLEAREAKNLTALVLGISLMLTFGVALFARREGYGLDFRLEEALALGVLTFAAFLPVIADVFAGGEERSARRAMASLPLSSATMFGAQVCAALGAAAVIFAALCAGWALAAAVLDAPTELRPRGGGWGDFSGVAAALVEAGALVIPLAAAAVTCFVAQVFRHALAATIAGWAAALILFAQHFDAGIMNLGTSFAHFPAFTTAAASSPWTYLALLLAFGFACRLRGSANRSWWARASRIALVLALSSSAAAGAVSFQEWRRFAYDFNDPAAYISDPTTPVLNGGQAAVVQLSKNDFRTYWQVDLRDYSAKRMSKDWADKFYNETKGSPFYRGLERQRTAIVRDAHMIDGEYLRRVSEERWTSHFNGPPVVVEALQVIPPRRRRPEIAYYFDIDKRLHRVDLIKGKDTPTDHVIDGPAFCAAIDEDGRWLTWYAEEGLNAVNLATGKHITYARKEPLGRIFNARWGASFRGAPVLRVDHDKRSGPSHATIQNGKFVPLPFSRRYSDLTDVDGQTLLGRSEENGLYLIGPNGQETATLRPPKPNALPKHP